MPSKQLQKRSLILTELIARLCLMKIFLKELPSPSTLENRNAIQRDLDEASETII